MYQKLERKLGRFAIPNLMRYVIIVYAFGFMIYLINPTFYYEWLMLDIDKLIHGQVWRIVTFLIQPIESNVLFTLLMLYVYFSIGTTLEKVWGTFGFNMFYFMGILSNILAVIIIYLITMVWFGEGVSYPISLEYLNMSMFLAFAVTFPEVRFYLLYLIPVKAKWLSLAYVCIFAYDVITAFIASAYFGIIMTVVTIVPLLNVIVYFLITRRYILSPKQIKRRTDFKRSYKQGQAMSYTTSVRSDGSEKSQTVITRHKCAVCGRTELDGDNLQFRFCSKCNGNYEYCQDHLFTHEHVQ